MSTTMNDPGYTNAYDARRRPIGDLLGDFADNASRLIGHEVELARAEVNEQVGKAKAASGMIAVAAVLGLCALGALTACAIVALALVMDAWLAALIVGGGLAVLAAIFGAVAKSQLSKVAPPVPDRAMKSVREDMEAVQDGVQDGVQSGRESNAGGQSHGA